jgi:hypothetical protein
MTSTTESEAGTSTASIWLPQCGQVQSTESDRIHREGTCSCSQETVSGGPADRLLAVSPIEYRRGARKLVKDWGYHLLLAVGIEHFGPEI